jgi:HEPN domain-containing protein
VSDKPTAPVGKEQRRSLQLNAIAPEVAKSKSLGRATGDSSDPRRWYEDAEKEMKRATRMLEDGDPEGAGPQLHMAVEKSLKGFLLSKKEKPHRVHSLRLLFVAALRYDKSLEAFRGVVHKIERLRRGRYPGAMTTPSSECDVGDLLEHAKKLVRKLQAAANTERQGPTHHV